MLGRDAIKEKEGGVRISLAFLKVCINEEKRKSIMYMLTCVAKNTNPFASLAQNVLGLQVSMSYSYDNRHTKQVLVFNNTHTTY